MGKLALVFALCLIATAKVARAADPGQRWEDLVAKLTSLDRVTGSAVDCGGVPGEFFQLSKVMIRTGEEADFRKLLARDEPVVRCMGLLALAQVNGQSSIATLKASLDDRAIVVYQPAGCSAGRTTVGGFARKLLFNTRDLESPIPPRPLLSERELIALDVEILAKDSTTGIHDEAASELINAVSAHAVLLRLGVLEEFVPHLQDYEIIKATGRLQPGLRRRIFLLECVHDKTLSLDSRLAAASALTHDTSNESFQGVEQEADSLNAVGGQRCGSHLVEVLNIRRGHERNMDLIRVETTWRGMEKIKDKVLVAFSANHPLALDDLLGSLNLAIVPDHADVRQTLVNSLIAISRNLEGSCQPWSTYSNTAYKLDAFLQSERQAQRNRILTDNECAEIEKNIRRFMEVPSHQTQPQIMPDRL